MLEIRKICCATDVSEPSRFAMLEAAELARHLYAELELVHVYAPPTATTDVLATAVEVPDTMSAELERTIARWRDEAERLVGRPVRSTVLAGDAASEIVRVARDRAMDLVVVGTHGRRGLRRLVIGSVAARVVREAPCAVVVARRREPPAGEVAAEAGE